MAFPEITGLLILGFALGAQLWLRSLFVSRQRLIVFLVASATFIVLFGLTVQLYDRWSMDPFSKLFLPPHQSPWYFLGYVGHRIFGAWALAAVAGYGSYLAARAMNRRFGERFFEEEEPFMFGLTVFVVGYPTFLFYIIVMFIVGLLFSLGFTVFKKGRAPLYHLWVPVGIFAILMTSLFFAPGALVKFNL